ncbi:MAG: hypothetical protein ACOH5I_26320 [Oligoflexus sp.]
MTEKETKKRGRKGATKDAGKMPLMALTTVEEKELVLDAETVEKLEKYLARNGGEKAGLSLSDAVAHLLLDKGPNGFKFSVQKSEPKKISLKLPKAAWDIAEKSAQKSGAELSDVLKELTTKI